MKITIAEAAQIKFTSQRSIQDDAIRGKLNIACQGDMMRVEWDRVFERYEPERPDPARLCDMLNARRLESKTILQMPLRDAMRQARGIVRYFKSMRHLIVPVNEDNLDLLLSTHDGLHDTPVYHDETYEEMLLGLAQDLPYYQVRVWISPHRYLRRDEEPSAVSTVTDVARRSGVSEYEVAVAVANGTLRGASYRGHLFILMDAAAKAYILSHRGLGQTLLFSPEQLQQGQHGQAETSR